MNCHCCSGNNFVTCCEPFLIGTAIPQTAKALMQSRYTAYVLHNADYVIATTAKSTRRFHNKSDILNWAKQNQWKKLEIIFASEKIVEFNAYYLDQNLQMQIHHEKSRFELENDIWKYVNFIND